MYADCQRIGMSRFVFGGHRFGIGASVRASVERVSCMNNPNNKHLCIFVSLSLYNRIEYKQRQVCAVPIHVRAFVFV